MKQDIKMIITYVKKKLDECGNISIHLGTLNDTQVKRLEKHFKVRKDFLGYYSFTPKDI